MEYFGEICSSSSGTPFRAMDMDHQFYGKAYIGRMKAVDDFGGDDLLYAIVYKGSKDTVDFNLFKSVCTTHNDKFFYAKSINKESTTFTMRNCLNAVENYPMSGSIGMSVVDFPMTFKDFGKLAYDTGILTSNKGSELLCLETTRQATVSDVSEVPLPPRNNAVTKVRNAIVKKKQVSDMIRKVQEDAKKGDCSAQPLFACTYKTVSRD